ncbi:hypothetical protein DACRYDRAFT_20319 [Dacryopinax primogenitus]|uniref:Extracellular membrane protein CFEM domain-containing protein n=1 Tax=Dacryopinax primogenitus (strain DJM 731) TaxID=1858805 RepID=M5GG07_DACPD|nr:uncharacterized protein DACRYDRAFT_20319 [Dacryopinax primogenitus]EJU04658.1 hypothetical protein DACRYDRAFT_20319 [Dacryopinax primogenitus]
MKFTSLVALAIGLTGTWAHKLPARGIHSVSKSILAGRADERPVFRRQLSATQCVTPCSGQTAQLNTLSECTTVDCVCSGMNTLSSDCQACLLQVDGLTAADWGATCADPGSLGDSQPTGVATSSPAQSPDPGSSSNTICGSSCSSASDSNDLTTILSCNPTDANCICTGLNQLSSGCLSCVLGTLGATQAQVQQQCTAELGGGGAVGAGAGAGGGGAAGPVGTTTAAVPEASGSVNDNTGGINLGSAAGGGSSGAAGSLPSTLAAKSGAGRATIGGLVSALVVVGGVVALL